MTATITPPAVPLAGLTTGDQFAGVLQQVAGQINTMLATNTVNTVSNAAGQTITAAQIVAGVYIATTRGAATTDTTDTAAAVLAALQTACSLSVAQLLASAFRFRYINGSGNAVTLAGGTGVTLTGTGATAVAAGAWQDFIFTFQSTTTATLTSIGKGTYA